LKQFPQGGGDRPRRDVPAQVQRAEDAHQHRLRVGPVAGPIAQDVLPHDHRRADLPLGVVVVEGDVRLVQESEQVVVAVAADPAAQPSGAGAEPAGRVVGEFAQPALPARRGRSAAWLHCVLLAVTRQHIAFHFAS
jgi:hypothetical protein